MDATPKNPKSPMDSARTSQDGTLPPSLRPITVPSADASAGRSRARWLRFEGRNGQVFTCLDVYSSTTTGTQHCVLRIGHAPDNGNNGEVLRYQLPNHAALERYIAQLKKLYQIEGNSCIFDSSLEPKRPQPHHTNAANAARAAILAGQAATTSKGTALKASPKKPTPSQQPQGSSVVPGGAGVSGMQRLNMPAASRLSTHPAGQAAPKTNAPGTALRTSVGAPQMYGFPGQCKNFLLRFSATNINSIRSSANGSAPRSHGCETGRDASASESGVDPAHAAAHEPYPSRSGSTAGAAASATIASQGEAEASSKTKARRAISEFRRTLSGVSYVKLLQ